MNSRDELTFRLELAEGYLKEADDLRESLTAMLPDFAQMGMGTHILVTYGDEELFAPPWEVIKQPEAEAGLKQAQKAVALGRRFREHFKPPLKE